MSKNDNFKKTISKMAVFISQKYDCKMFFPLNEDDMMSKKDGIRIIFEEHNVDLFICNYILSNIRDAHGLTRYIDSLILRNFKKKF